jgi:hypothetical protein
MRKVLFSLVLVLVSLFGYGQQTLVETMGAPSGTVSIASHETSNGFSQTALTYSGTADVRITTASTGYAGASGSGNIFFNGQDRDFIVAGLTPTSQCSIDVTFGIHKSTNAETGSNFAIEYSTAGSSGPWLSAGSISLPIGAGTATWAQRTVTGLPNNVLAIRFRKTDAGTNQFRLDDVQIIGNGTGCQLPITLISFKASLNSSNQAVLKWATASEKDNHYFEIERSKNAIDFESLGKMNGKGTSDLRNDYAFTDETPLKGINYYRLKQVDFDGTFSYTRPESVITEGDGSISLYPNPTVNVLKINFEDLDQIETATIYNQSGVLMKNLQGSKSSIDIQELPQGKYILQIRLADQRIITNSFVKF